MLRRTPWLAVLLVAGLLAAALALRLTVAGPGGVVGHPSSASSAPPLLNWPADPVVLDLRLARAAAAAAVGSALALAGVMLQTLLRNPLAAPDLLGLSAGAQLGVTVWAFIAGLGGFMAHSAWSWPPAALGALAAMAIVHALGRRHRRIDPVRLVLIGVMVSIIAGSASVLLRSLMPPDPASGIGTLLLGAITDDHRPWQIALCAALAALALAWGLSASRTMDSSALGDDEAASVGVNLPRLRAALFVMSGLITAGAVAVAGPIGFVGLVCPHAMRLLGGPRHGPLLAGSAILGAAVLVLADALVRAIPTPAGRLPIGVITALVGGPIFIAMLRGGRVR